MTKARDLANAGTALTTVSATELGYLDGVTSAVQTQINSKIGQSTAINPTIVDAKGDIVAATAADTVARLAVGANNTVLTADSAEATGLKWASVASGGGLTLLSTTSLSGVTTTVSSISQDYKHLLVIAKNCYTSGGDSIYLRINGSTSSDLYHAGTQANSGTVYAMNNNAVSFLPMMYAPENVTGRLGTAEVWLYNYTSTSNHSYFVRGFSGNGGTNKSGINMQGYRVGTSAITSLAFNGNADNCTGTIYIYGVN